jgi:hypothetical protein
MFWRRSWRTESDLTSLLDLLAVGVGGILENLEF